VEGEIAVRERVSRGGVAGVPVQEVLGETDAEACDQGCAG